MDIISPLVFIVSLCTRCMCLRLVIDKEPPLPPRSTEHNRWIMCEDHVVNDRVRLNGKYLLGSASIWLMSADEDHLEPVSNSHRSVGHVRCSEKAPKYFSGNAPPGNRHFEDTSDFSIVSNRWQFSHRRWLISTSRLASSTNRSHRLQYAS